MKRMIACIAALGVMTALTACKNDSSSVSRAEKETSSASGTTEETSETAEQPSAPDDDTSEADSSTEGAETWDTEQLADEAVRKMNCMTKIWGLLSGNIVCDEMDTFEQDGNVYLKVVDLAGYSSVDEMRSEVSSTCTGTVRDGLLSDIDNSIMESEDGSIYANTAAKGYYIFPTDSGVKVSDVTDNSFTATTVDSDDMNGAGTAHFVYEDGSWLIDSYEFK